MAHFTFNNYPLWENNNNSNMIDEMEKLPKTATVNSILNYSKALSVRKSKHLDHIKMIVN